MRNALLDSMLSSEATRKGHIPFQKLTMDGLVFLGHTGDINYLIDTANKYLGKGDFKNLSYIPFDHEFGYSIGIWMGRFLEKGFTIEMLKEIRQELGRIRFFHELNPAIPSRGKPLPHWDYIAYMEDFRDPKTTAAYAFSQQLTIDGFAGLKRCQMSTCQKFFIGRSNAVWCSKACGSKHRVTKKRKKDRNG